MLLAFVMQRHIHNRRTKQEMYVHRSIVYGEKIIHWVHVYLPALLIQILKFTSESNKIDQEGKCCNRKNALYHWSATARVQRAKCVMQPSRILCCVQNHNSANAEICCHHCKFWNSDSVVWIWPPVNNIRRKVIVGNS